MKLVCNICGKEMDYPFMQISHRHEEYEMDLVPVNFWEVKDYLSNFEINISDGKVVLSIFKAKSKSTAGNTPLIKYSSNVYLKDESMNPTGSFKDRGMESLMNEVLMHGKNTIAVVSCGSGAISAIYYAKEYGIKTIVFVHKDVASSSLSKIKDADTVVLCENFIKSYEDFMEYSLKHQEVYWGFLNTNVSYMLGLRSMAYEIIRDMDNVPDIILIPCGSGMDIVAQNMAFREMYEKGSISKIPKIGVVEIEGGNPIKTGFSNGEEGYLYVIPEPIESKTILSNDTCFNYKKICDMAKRGEAFFVSVTDEEIDNFISSSPDFEMKYDYTSLAAMAALKAVNPEDKVVVVLTCKNRNGGIQHE